MRFAAEDTITDIAAGRWRDLADNPRLGEVMEALVRHLHGFAREVKLTEAEWYEATEFLTRVGQKSNDKRKEIILLSDVLGLSMLLMLLNNRKSETVSQPTLLGPFYIPDSPDIPQGGRLPAVKDEDGTPLFVSGRIIDEDGKPIAGAIVDVWQTDDEGIYEAQLHDDEVRHRGTQRTDTDGRYSFRSVVPVDYSVPTDGPVGQLLAMTSISPYRPSHIHFQISAPGHDTLITHLFDRQSPKLDSDVVFGTREMLLVDFVRQDAGIAPNGDHVDRAYATLAYDFILPRVAIA